MMKTKSYPWYNAQRRHDDIKTACKVMSLCRTLGLEEAGEHTLSLMTTI